MPAEGPNAARLGEAAGVNDYNAGKSYTAVLVCYLRASRVSKLHDLAMLIDSVSLSAPTKKEKPVMIRVVLLLGLTVLASAVNAQPHVRDADTIVVNGTPVRLEGIDAPELNTRSGQNAKRWMVNFLQGKEIRCENA